MTEFIDSLDLAVDRLLARVPGPLAVGAPLGIGQPHRLLNALYGRIERDPSRTLALHTALSLDPPEPGGGLEGRFTGPFVARHFGEDFPRLAYVAAQKRDARTRNSCDTRWQPCRSGGSREAFPVKPSRLPPLLRNPGQLQAPYQRRALAASTTRSTVKPKCGIRSSIGALAPKVSMPTTAPSRPTYLRQKPVTPASIATRLRQASGSTDSRYSAGWRSNTSLLG